jgi:hypothetical protein
VTTHANPRAPPPPTRPDAAAAPQVVSTPDFVRRSLDRCLELVCPPAAAGRMLSLDAGRWEAAARGLSRIGYLSAFVPNALSLAADLWPPAAPAPAPATPPAPACVVPDGRAIALQIRGEAAARAQAFARRNGRAPRLAVVRVGEARPAAAQERLALFSSEEHSWFAKRTVVEAAGIAYEEILLPPGPPPPHAPHAPAIPRRRPSSRPSRPERAVQCRHPTALVAPAPDRPRELAPLSPAACLSPRPSPPP